MRAFQLTPEYDPPNRADTWDAGQRRRWLLELDEYEMTNLQRLLDAVAGKTKEHDVPVTAFNNGDWVGQIGFYLPETSERIQPNRPYPSD